MLRIDGLLGSEDDPVVWQRGTMLPDGRFSILMMTRSIRRGLLKAFGRAWLRDYLRDAERKLRDCGVS